MKLSSIPFFFFLGAAHLLAQSVESDIRIPRPSHTAHWTIAYSYAGSKPAPSDLKEAEYIITGTISSAQETLINGNVDRSYQIEALELTEQPVSHHVQMTSLAGDNPSQGYRGTYPGFEGLGPKALTGLVTAFGEECYHFQNPFQEGWVSKETGLPKAFKKGNMTGKYTFLDPPTTPLQLPSPFKEFVEGHIASGPPPGQAASSGFQP